MACTIFTDNFPFIYSVRISPLFFFRSMERNLSSPFDAVFLSPIIVLVCIGNSMICSDIWHKYHK